MACTFLFESIFICSFGVKLYTFPLYWTPFCIVLEHSSDICWIFSWRILCRIYSSEKLDLTLLKKSLYSSSVACSQPSGRYSTDSTCPTCSIMSGFGGAGAFSDGKYNITNDFGGSLYQYIGKKTAWTQGTVIGENVSYSVYTSQIVEVLENEIDNLKNK